MNPKKHVLSTFGLVMINVIAVDSLRTIPFSAAYGFSLILFYAIAALTFFIPTALVSAELASAWPMRGGVYIWVREALGNPIAFLVIWVQWIYNICWFPTILALLAATLAYLLHNHHLVDNKFYMLSVIISTYWATTFINMRGMRASSWLSTFTALIGTLLPLLLIIGLGAYWLWQGHPSQIEFSAKALLPNETHLKNIMLFTNVLFGLSGIEMSAVHAQEVRNPQRDYPRALLYSSLIILSTLICASLAVAIVVPHLHLGLIDGLLEAYKFFLSAYHIEYLMPLVASFIIIGGIGGVGAWIIGPSKGLLVAAEDGCLPKSLAKINKHQAPSTLLWLQGGIFTLLCSVFLLMPSVNSSFWVLSDLTAMLALVLYIFMFIAAVILRYKYPHQKRAYKIPGGKVGIYIIAGLGITACIVTIAIGFYPPEILPVGNIWIYEGILAGGFFGFCAIPFVIYKLNKKNLLAKNS